MEKLSFKAKVAHVAKDSREKYYTIGFADDKYDFKHYILFQLTFDPNETNRMWCDCNGSVTWDKVDYVKISKGVFEAQVNNVLVAVDIAGIRLSPKLMSYAESGFGDKLLK